jgi:signal transduction histidine kinase
MFWAAPALIGIASTGVFAGLARYAPDIPGPRIWMLAPLCQAIVMSLLLLPLSVLDLRGHGILSNLQSLVAPACWAVGTQRFHGRRPFTGLAIGCITVGLLLYIAFTYAWPNGDARILMGTAFMVPLWTAAALAVWSTPNGPGQLPARVLAFGLFGIGALAVIHCLQHFSGQTTPSVLVTGTVTGLSVVTFVFGTMTTVLSAPVLGLLVIARLTERIEAEKRRVRDLAQRLETAREEERAHIAHTLHEEVAQDLTAIDLLLGSLRAGPDGRSTLASARELVTGELRKCVQKLRGLTSSIRPPMLAHLSLPEAIAEYAQTFSTEHGLSVDVVPPAHFVELDEAGRVVFFRAAQEVLANVIQHASATHVTITFELRERTPIMAIRDDGIGVTDENLRKERALGILGLRERFAALGGGVHIGRNEPRGTIVSVHLPSSVEGAIRAQSRRTG